MVILKFSVSNEALSIQEERNERTTFLALLLDKLKNRTP
jgi:hypothetical protein